MHTTSPLATPLFSVISLAAAADRDAAGDGWPSRCRDGRRWPGEHPRLLFRRTDLPEIKRRAGTEMGKRIVARLGQSLAGGDAMPKKFSAATKAVFRYQDRHQR